MEKIKLTKITHYEKDRDNKPLLTKNNKPYVRCLIVDTQGRRISGFGSAITQAWEEGDEVSVEIEQRGNYLNFKIPDQRVTRAEFEEVKKDIKFLKDEVAFLHNKSLKDDVQEIEEADLGEPPLPEELQY